MQQEGVLGMWGPVQVGKDVGLGSACVVKGVPESEFRTMVCLCG